MDTACKLNLLALSNIVAPQSLAYIISLPAVKNQDGDVHKAKGKTELCHGGYSHL